MKRVLVAVWLGVFLLFVSLTPLVAAVGLPVREPAKDMEACAILGVMLATFAVLLLYGLGEITRSET